MDTPIAFLFFPQPPEWAEVACDPALTAFLAFLRTEGAQTERTKDEWNTLFETHLNAPSCAQWLFRTWLAKRAEKTELPPPALWLPSTLAERFGAWERAFSQDQKALEAWASWAQGGWPGIDDLVFRGIPLAALVLPERLNPALGAGISSPSGLSVVKVAS
jgi:hypothetical protein